MKIKQLHLTKYKRFFDLTIDFGDSPRRIVALVGPNGCGKSSVFDAMLFHCSAYARLGGGSRPNYKYHSLEDNPTYNYQNVEISFSHTGQRSEPVSVYAFTPQRLQYPFSKLCPSAGRTP